jgi:hypothetical protein
VLITWHRVACKTLFESRHLLSSHFQLLNMMRKFYFLFSLLCFVSLFAGSVAAQESSQLQGTRPIVAEPAMLVYPNPNAGDEAHITFSGFKADDLLVVVYDMLGREMYSKIQLEENNGFLFSFDPALAPGVYLIIASANDVVYKQKLVVK